MKKRTVKIAILDLYDGVTNQGMRCIREIITQFGEKNQFNILWDEFDVRQKLQTPELSYDIFISSGGPGSPLESVGSKWESAYFKWLQVVQRWNNNEANVHKKHVFFICHSFQLACRYFKVGQVAKRKSTSFGVFPIHVVEQQEPVFSGLNDPFYAVDSRDYQPAGKNGGFHTCYRKRTSAHSS